VSVAHPFIFLCSSQLACVKHLTGPSSQAQAFTQLAYLTSHSSHGAIYLTKRAWSRQVLDKSEMLDKSENLDLIGLKKKKK